VWCGDTTLLTLQFKISVGDLDGVVMNWGQRCGAVKVWCELGEDCHF